MNDQPQTSDSEQFDYIIVGSGAGGGPLAARLAQAGKRVLVIEAGSNQATEPPTAPAREISQVPILHAASTEHKDLSWQFFVKHYDNPPTGEDPKWHKPDAAAGEDETHEGIFYPRAAALGGCTVHNAMITIAGPNSDWDDLADFVNDDSWRGQQMRSYFERMERNEYLDEPTATPKTIWGRIWDNAWWLFRAAPDHTGGGHGFKGWLHTSISDVTLGLGDKQLLKMLKAAFVQSSRAGIVRFGVILRNIFRGRLIRRLLKGKGDPILDPNHAQTQAEAPAGVFLIPLAVCGQRTTIHTSSDMPLVARGRRSSPREFLLQTQASHPHNLTIWTDCFVTRVLFADGNPPRARGVELLRGKRLYKAHPQYSTEAGTQESAFVKDGGEIILCGGSFNTPQLLMLSGIGDESHLAEHNIPCRVHSPGVGRNLQDRYEVTVISEMKQDFALLKGATLRLPDPGAQPDPHLNQWRKEGTGLYTSNGAVLGIMKRSRPDLPQPDLFIFGIPGKFEGYEVGYSKVGDIHNLFTWTILKAHTQNHDGTVRLRNADPLATPLINFHYFNEVTRRDHDKGANDPDLLAVVDAVKFVRGIAKHARLWIRDESFPGFSEVPDGSDARLKDWIRRICWGHHACGTCRMGPDDDEHAVLDSRFRVRGVDGLRVVDASIFPDIPGYFIVANIYVASEKASDVILEDANYRTADSAIYPRDLREKEVKALTRRRGKDNFGPVDSAQPDRPKPVPVTDSGDWSSDVTGVGLSGGGIRSATLNLGVLQALAGGNWLRRIDFLSTVSGGGYIGSFLGRFYDRLRKNPLAGSGAASGDRPPDCVEKELTDPDSLLIGWLRKHGNYIAPNGQGDWRLNLATFIRNILSVHFVVGLLLFAGFGLANLIRYWLFDTVLAAQGLVISKGHFPLGHLLEALLGPFYSPWFILFELLLLFLVVPRIVGYWLVSQDRTERYQGPPMLLLFVAVTVLLLLSVNQGLALEPLFIALALLSSFVHVEQAWFRGRLHELAVGSGGVETQRLRARNFLTYDLGLALALAGGALAFAVIDTIGHSLQQLADNNQSYAKAFAAIGAVLVAIVPIAQKAASLFAGDQKPGAPSSAIIRTLKKSVTAGLLALVLFTVPLIFYSFASHAAYDGGSQVCVGAIVTALALLMTFILTHPKARTFVNRSSLAQLYGARLARAYLGASNPLRHRPEGANVTEVVAGDDVASIRDYRPHEAGGPLHLINVVINQTVDFSSGRGNRDRQGENFAVSSIGASVGETWHSAWADPPDDGAHGAAKKRPARLEPLGYAPGTSHPLVDEAGEPTNCAEMLSLRQWIGISGAAVGPGRGQTTRLGTALLFGLANLRTGYWWDSGITEADRQGFPKLSFTRRLLYLVPRIFSTQFLLLFEWVARYPGPWERYWNIADGGFFENMGGYELIRRRVPRIILSDGTADPACEFECLAEMIRKVRIDFDACVESFSAADIAAYVPAELQKFVGTLEELVPPKDAACGTPRKHAALLWVTYQTGPARKSVVLYLKASLTGDENTDIGQYQATHPEFPNESTADQFFDEAQWESYRALGEHIAAPLFKTEATWFQNIPL